MQAGDVSHDGGAARGNFIFREKGDETGEEVACYSKNLCLPSPSTVNCTFP